MAIKAISHRGSDSQTSSKIDLNLKEEISSQVKRKIQNNVGEFLVESILDSVANESSPVSGEAWPKLKKGSYRDKKAALNGNTQANMELEGDMLNSLKFKAVDEGIEIGFFDQQSAKADGHNKLSGRQNRTPKRRFLPRTGQRFDAEINEEIKKIALDAIGDSARFSKATFEGVKSKAGLISTLSEVFSVKPSEAKSIVSRNPKLQDILNGLGLLKFL